MRYLSLFSGMEAATIAWRPLWWECVGVSEIDPAACAVLRHRLPGVPNLGSVTEITDADIAALGPIDVVIGGSPCQDLSVAGKRAGLAGERSSLFHEQLRIFNAARTLCGARWLVWENVPGAFSSNKGRDFAVVVGAMAGCELPVPADGFGSEGVSLGDAGFVEWAVLDSQWFGVAQRRRRVFAVLDTGDWANRPPVLLEPESLRGDSPPSRETGEVVAPTLDVRAGRSGETSFHTSGGLVPQWSACLATGTGQRFDPETETLIPTIVGGFDVAHTLRATGFDASEDGTGRGTPLVPCIGFLSNAGSHGGDVFDEICPTLRVQKSGGGGIPAIAFGCKDSDPARSVSGDVSPTLRAMGHAGSHANAGGQVAVAFAHQGGGVQTTLGYDPDSGVAPTLSVGQTPAVHVGWKVRRLTPMECERLQGAEDTWTLVPNAKGKPMADGPRYKMLGNSFTATVIRWIGRRIEAAVAYSEDRREAA